ncbi:MAG: glycine cleavage system aminomethyltransferase GcvT [Desulfovibrionaceae bacterium]|nr:glycine cleavage system aminomethyltransferase GcvT [Desulfovibrionaceae bacterium]
MSDLFKTPLHSWHLAQGAKTAPFAGWDMPIQYAGILAEHKHTREAASLFDICHMGEFLVRGKDARAALSRIVTHNLDTLAPLKCRYGFLLNPEGGVLDDLIVYRLAEEEYMLVVNGACTASDFAWIADHLQGEAAMENVSDVTAKIDLQGPKSLDALDATLGKVLGRSFRDLKYFNFLRLSFEGAPLIVSRTGYTGELGYELYVAAAKAVELWELVVADARVEPAGLGARDTLRLEMGLPLYGQDLDTAHTPAEAGYEPLLSSPADYVGKGADRAVRERLVALTVEGRRSPRHGDAVLAAGGSGESVGVVTSGSFAPSLGHAVALAYVRADASEAASFLVKGARAELGAVRADLPFYKEGTARIKL